MTFQEPLAEEVRTQSIECLRYGISKIEHCLQQLTTDQLWWRPHSEMNAIGNLLLHLEGNLGQWIVAGVGGQQDSRNRPSEFAHREAVPADPLMQSLRDTIQACEMALNQVSAEQWLDHVRIQGFEVTKLGAMMHSVTHFQGHVQEIISMTRQQLGDGYRFDWVPKTKEEGAI